jgi:sulfane dehydrogenase subunit SoxC
VFVAYGQNGECYVPKMATLAPGGTGGARRELGEVLLRRIEVGDKPYGTKDEVIHYVDLMPGGKHRQYTSTQE